MSTSRERRVVLPAILALLLALGLSVGVQAPSDAATCPTLSTGSSGASVTSLQYLLTSRGYATTADGVVGPTTWQELLGRTSRVRHPSRESVVVSPNRRTHQ